MAPEEAQPAGPRRRGRPPGSKNRRPRGRRAGGGDLVSQLNTMVGELIKKNRELQRQVAKLSAKASKTSANKGVERGIRTVSRRVQRALGSKTTRRRRASTNGRRKKTATTRRRRAS